MTRSKGAPRQVSWQNFGVSKRPEPLLSTENRYRNDSTWFGPAIGHLQGMAPQLVTSQCRRNQAIGGEYPLLWMKIPFISVMFHLLH